MHGSMEETCQIPHRKVIRKEEQMELEVYICSKICRKRTNHSSSHSYESDQPCYV